MGGWLGYIVGLIGAFAWVRRALTERTIAAASAPTEPAPEPVAASARRGGSNGVMADEQLTDWLRAECRRLGVDASRVDITTVDGVVYLRGRETDSPLVDTLVSLARSAPGSRDVIDEVKRE
ncbi:MAG TPA: BON domain-containing protein [Chloroflexota bacterium]